MSNASRTAELGDVGAGGEDLRPTGDDDRARRVGGQFGGDRLELAEHVPRQRVDLRVVERDHGDAVVSPLEQHQFSHGGDPTGAAVPGSSHERPDHEQYAQRNQGAPSPGSRPGLVLVVADPDLVDAAGLLGELDLRRLVGDEAGAEALRLVAELLHHVRPHDPLGEPRVVLDVGRLLQQPAPEEALDHQRTQVRAGRVQGGRVAGRAAAHDDDVLDLFGHVCLASVQCFGVTLLCIVPVRAALRLRDRGRARAGSAPALPATA